MDDSDMRAARAACVGPRLIEFGGRTILLPPLDPTDSFAIRDELRRQCMSSSKDPLTLVNDRIASAEKAGRPLSPTMIDAMVRAAMSASARQEAKSEPSDDEITARVHTLDGCRWVVWYRLRKADPTVTQQWVNENLPDLESTYVIANKIGEVDGLRHLEEKKA